MIKSSSVKLNIREMTFKDIDFVVTIHIDAFKNFFTTKLGIRYLKKYYGLVLSYKNPIAFVAINQNETIEGFAVGFIQPSNFYDFLKKNKFYLLPSILYGLAMSPSLILFVARNFFRVRQNSKSTLNDSETTELSSIAVNSNSAGVGSKLLKKFIETSWHLDCNCIKLTTDAHDNDRVNNFYIKHGFILSRIEDRNDRRMNHYLLQK